MPDSYFGNAYIPVESRVAFKKELGRKRREWLERQWARSPRCYYCKNTTELKPRDYNTRMDHHTELVATLDHAVPVSGGGPDHPSNYRLACAVCNTLKADRPEREFIAELKAEGIR